MSGGPRDVAPPDNLAPPEAAPPKFLPPIGSPGAGFARTIGAASSIGTQAPPAPLGPPAPLCRPCLAEPTELPFTASCGSSPGSTCVPEPSGNAGSVQAAPSFHGLVQLLMDEHSRVVADLNVAFATNEELRSELQEEKGKAQPKAREHAKARFEAPAHACGRKNGTKSVVFEPGMVSQDKPPSQPDSGPAVQPLSSGARSPLPILQEGGPVDEPSPSSPAAEGPLPGLRESGLADEPQPLTMCLVGQFCPPPLPGALVPPTEVSTPPSSSRSNAVDRTSTEKSIYRGCNFKVVFELQSVWTKEPRRVLESSFGAQGSGLYGAVAERHTLESFSDRTDAKDVDKLLSTLTPTDPEQKDGLWKKFITEPSNPRRVAWDASGAILIFYDIFAIPISAFEPPDNAFGIMMDWVTLLFWTANVFASFLVGYVVDGEVVMDPKLIARGYFLSWFLVDMLVVVPDWLFTITALAGQASGGGGSSVRLVRILRLIRLTRLVRLLKLKKLMEKINDLIDSEYLSIWVNIVKMIVLLLAINHIIACLWFWVGSQSSGASWIAFHNFVDIDWGEQYAVSFHWSITQFTPSSMHVQPQNVSERVFAITVVVFALVGFSYVVGSITGSLSQLRGMQEEQTKQFWNLRRYLKHNKVDMDLSLRIMWFLEHAWECQESSNSIATVKIFSLLSKQLLAELHSTLYLPHLVIHPLFEFLASTSNSAVRLAMARLATTAIESRALARSDTFFVTGETATHLCLVKTGELRYTRQDSLGRPKHVIVQPGRDWISEFCLWIENWVHLGSLEAIIECDLLLICTKKFRDIIPLNPMSYSLVLSYARNFLQWINSVRADDLSDIFEGSKVTDKHRDFIDISEVDGFDNGKGTLFRSDAQRLTKNVRRSVKMEGPP